MNVARNNLLITLADQSSEAILVLDSDLTIQLINQSAENILQCFADKVIAIPFKEFCKKYNIPFIFDITTKNPSINNFFSEIQGIKLNWSIQKVIDEENFFFLIKTVDFIENKNQNKIHQLNTMIENMPCNVYWVDKECKMIDCNQNVLNMLNMTRENFRGKSYEELSALCNWPEGLYKKLKNDDLSVMHSETPIFAVEDPPIPHADGTFSNFLTSRVPLRNKEGEIVGIAGISVEITALKEARAKAELANNAKTEFIANMSHDIRTPLSGVVGMSQMIEDTAIDPTQKQYAHWLHDSGDQLLQMLNGILDVVSADNANENDLHEEPFELKQMIHNLISVERPTTVVKGLELLSTVDETIPPKLISDHNKIHRIILNLLGNAVKFTSKGQVDICVSLLEQEPKRVLLRFSIKDTGIGIPYELQDKVFDRFFRVSPSYKGIYTGHGVGLHIAQSYAHLLGGNIFLTSEPAVGTTFYFDLWLTVGSEDCLPVSTNGIKNASIPASAPEIPPARPLTEIPVDATPTPVSTVSPDAPMLLLVEDNTIALRTLEHYVTQAGFQFMSAVNGSAALELAKTHGFDLIITDLGLPGLSGIEFVQALRVFETDAAKKPVPIIALTAHADIKVKQECLDAGMNEAFTKPMTTEGLNLIKSTWFSHNGEAVINVAKANEAPSPAGALGIDLPDTEAELFELATFPLLDAKSALKEMNNNKELFNRMLKTIVDTELSHDLNEINEAWSKDDWATVESIAHRMKGGFVYCGISRLAHACQYLERYHRAGHTNQLQPLYQQVVRVAAETTVAIKRWLAMQG